MEKNNYVGLRDVFEFRYTAQGKAKLNSLLAENFIERRIDDLIILDDLPVDPEQLEGEEKFKIKK